MTAAARCLSVVAMASLLSACGSGGNDTPAPFPTPFPMPVSSGWQCRYCTGGSVTGAGVVTLPIGGSCPAPRAGNNPQDPSFNVSACRHVDYVTRGPMPLNGSITLDYTVSGNNPVFGYTTAAGNTAGAPPQLTLMIEHANDQTLSNGLWRWDSNTRIPISLGHQRVTVPLSFSNWAAVAGSSPGTQAQFNDVLANLGAVGFVLGGGDSAGHGLYLTSGSAVLTVNSFTSP